VFEEGKKEEKKVPEKKNVKKEVKKGGKAEIEEEPIEELPPKPDYT